MPNSEQTTVISAVAPSADRTIALMSAVATRTAHRLHIIAVPLTKPLPHAKSKKILTYYQFHITHQPASVNGDGKARKDSVLSRWLPEGGIVNWATGKATETWAGFGKQPKGWKRSLYEMGERVADRLDFEELALKSIDPSLGPTLSSSIPSSTSSTKELEEAPLKIPLLYPPSISTGPETLRELSAFASHRIPMHRRGFYLWAIAAPFTAPISIIPIIPNVPFFFCVWRSWSHYRAYKASQYLDSLLEHNVIVPEESQLLDMVYDQYEPRSPFEPDAEKNDDGVKSKIGGEPQDALLLTRDAVPHIARMFSLLPSVEADLDRAVKQARLRVASDI